MLTPPIGSPLHDDDVDSPVRPVLGWVAVVLVVAAGVLLVVADGRPQAEVEHLWSTDGAATYSASPAFGGVDAPYPEVIGDIGPQDAPGARRLALLALAAGIAAITVARARRTGPLFDVLVALAVLSIAASSWLGMGSTVAYGTIGHGPASGDRCELEPALDCPISGHGLGDGVTEQWDWRTPQLAMQLGAAGLLLVAAIVARAAHRRAPELQTTLSDRDVARLLR